jgi:hypothetical protein
MYREQLRARLDSLIDQVANMVWRAESARKRASSH